jgi:hypothetical protein
VTGDGNSNEGRTTFPECVEQALRNNWSVELFSWRRSTSQVYEVMAQEYEQFAISYLDDIEEPAAMNSVSFATVADEGGREQRREGAVARGGGAGRGRRGGRGGRGAR